MSTDDMLNPTEATDSDDVRNRDGDEVVDPPEDWSGVTKTGMTEDEQREGETLDQRVAQEVPDVAPEDIDPRDADDADNLGVSTEERDGAPEDGDSLFPVVE